MIQPITCTRNAITSTTFGAAMTGSRRAGSIVTGSARRGSFRVGSAA